MSLNKGSGTIKLASFITIERQAMGVNKYAGTSNKKACINHRKKEKCGVIFLKYAIVFASSQLRITRLCKYPIHPYLERR